MISHIIIYEMSCNSRIHDELKNMMESTCPFCDQQLVEVDEVVELCCDEQELENIDGMNTSVNCGKIYGYDYAAEYFDFDFYENMHKIRKKSVYHRNYHIDNVMNIISFKNNIQLTQKQINQIHKVFVEIDSVLHEVNDGRKRMISIKYVIKQLFKMLGLPYKDIQVTKSKRTMKYYKRYWGKVQSLIDRLQLTSSPPCWMTINKRIIISSIVPVIQHGRQGHCHLNLTGMVANHL